MVTGVNSFEFSILLSYYYFSFYINI
jgi:hypothetical protein